MRSYLDGVFRVGGFVDAALADREGAHADVFLQHVAVAEQQVLPVQLLRSRGFYCCCATARLELSRTHRLTCTTGWGWGFTCSSEPSSSSRVDAIKLKPLKSWWAPALGGTPGESRDKAEFIF